MARIKALFIDDDGSVRVLASAMLNSHIFETLLAGSAAEAQDILNNTPVDIIVCDVMMPEEDGIQFCIRLRKGGNKTPFLFLSAIGLSQSVASGLAAGADAYLVKPFEI